MLALLLAWGLACDDTGEIPGNDDVGDDDAGDDDAGDDDAVADDSLPVLDLQDELAAAVAASDGWGGGVLHVSRPGGAPAGGAWWEGAAGDAVRQPAVAMTSEDTFEIASTSKAFTAATVLLLVEDGAFGLDDPIGGLLPAELTTGLLVIDQHDHGPELTVRQLLAHTAGLPDYWYDPPFVQPGVNAFLEAYIADPDRFWEPEELIAYAKQLDPIDVPGATWHYSDTGYVLAGLIVEEVTGEAFHDVCRARLLQPLGLDDTYLTYREAPASPGTESHRYEWHWDMHGKVHNSADWAGGGLVSSTRDLDAFLAALQGETLFADPATTAAMQDWRPTGTSGVWYGLGLFRAALPGGLGELWGHDGYGNSWMYAWPQGGVRFVGTLNQTETDWWPLVVAAAEEIEAVR